MARGVVENKVDFGVKGRSGGLRGWAQLGRGEGRFEVEARFEGMGRFEVEARFEGMGRLEVVKSCRPAFRG